MRGAVNTASPRTVICAFLVLVLCCLTYGPAIVLTYGMHNDYLLITPNWSNGLPFLESHHLVLIGRGLQAVLINQLSRSLETIADLSWVRFASFTMMMTLVVIMVAFLRKTCGLASRWLLVAALGVLFLPTTQLLIIYCTPCVAGSFNLLLVAGSYLLLLQTEKRPLARAIPFFFLSFTVFMACLYIYPSTAVFVFVFTACRMIFRSSGPWSAARRWVIRDLGFYGFIIALYGLSIWIFFIQPGFQQGKFANLQGTMYQFGTAPDISAKIALLKDITLTASGGSWFLLGKHLAGRMYLFLLGGLLLAAVYVRRPGLWSSGPADRQEIVRKWRYGAERIFFLLICFFLVNGPSLAAGNVTEVPGFRTLFPASVLFWLVILAAVILLYDAVPGRRARQLIFYAALFLVLLQVFPAHHNTFATACNHFREMRFLKAQTKLADFESVQKIVVIPLPPYQGESLIAHRLPFEFGHTVTEHGLAVPIVEEALAEIGRDPLPVFVDPRKLVYYDPYTHLININHARLDEHDPVSIPVLVTTSAFPEQRIEAGYFPPYLAFLETGEEGQLPFWRMKDLDGQWFQLSFRYPVRFQRFSFAAMLPDGQQGKDVRCYLQKSQDGLTWRDVALIEDVHPLLGRVYQIPLARPNRQYRFTFKHQGPQPIQALGAVQLMFE